MRRASVAPSFYWNRRAARRILSENRWCECAPSHCCGKLDHHIAATESAALRPARSCRNALFCRANVNPGAVVTSGARDKRESKVRAARKARMILPDVARPTVACRFIKPARYTPARDANWTKGTAQRLWPTQVSHFRHGAARRPARFFPPATLFICLACGPPSRRAYRPVTETWPSG